MYLVQYLTVILDYDLAIYKYFLRQHREMLKP